MRRLLFATLYAGCQAPPDSVTRAALSEADQMVVMQQQIDQDPAWFGICDGCRVVVDNVDTDSAGRWHTVLRHTYAGIPLLLRRTAHFDRVGTPYRPQGGRVKPRAPKPDDPRPVLVAKEAIAIAGFEKAPNPTARLAFRPRYENGALSGFQLVWQVDEQPVDGDGAFVDAKSGVLLRRYSNVMTVLPHRGYSEYSGTVSLNTQPGYVGFLMCDTTKFMNTVCTQWGAADDGSLLFDPITIQDADDVWGTGVSLPASATSGYQSAQAQTMAVDAQFGLHNVWTMIRNVLGLSQVMTRTPGPDIVVYGQVRMARCGNASGGGRLTFLPSCTGPHSFATPDIVAHEYSHDLYPFQYDWCEGGEVGGGCESFGDILGVMAESYLAGGGLTNDSTSIPEGAGNWQHGELTGHVHRYLDKPSRDGHSLDYASGTVDFETDAHYMAGPLNRAFYFLAAGVDTNPLGDHYSYLLPSGMAGIGKTRAMKLLWATYDYLDDGMYQDVRDAMEVAAFDQDPQGLCGTLVKAVQDAYGAVNIGPVADRTPPVVNATLTQTASGLLSLQVDVTEPSAIEFPIRVLLDGAPWSEEDVGSFTLTRPAVGLTSGVHTVTVTATDNRCNTTTIQRTIMLDNDAPVIISVLKSGPMWSPTFTVNLSDTNPVQVQILSGSLLLAEDASPPYQLPVSLVGWPTNLYSLTIRATDSLSHSTTVSYGVWADNSTPMVTLGYSGSAPPFSIDAQVLDFPLAFVAGPITVEFRVDNVTVAASTEANDDFHFSYSPTSSGNHTITALVHDAFFNTASASIPAPLDQQGPFIELSFDATGTPHAQINATDTCGIEFPVKLFLDGVLRASLQSVPVTQPISGMLPGHHTVRVEATDRCGNTSYREVPADIMNQPPVVVSVVVTSAMPKRPIITVEATDDVRVDRVQVLRGTTVLATMSNAPYKVTLDTSTWADALHTLVVRAYDDEGFTANRTIMVRADNTPPSLTSASCIRVGTSLVMSADATDGGSGMELVQFSAWKGTLPLTQIGGGNDTSAPYQYIINNNADIVAHIKCIVGAKDRFGNWNNWTDNDID